MKQKLKNIWDTILPVVVGITASCIASIFITIVNVDGDSMLPNFHNGEKLILINSRFINKYTYEDVIVCKGVDRYIIKRVIGLPGDTLQTINGELYRNNEKLDESAYNIVAVTNGIDAEIIVPDNHVYVLGDNRTASHDSRNIGSVPAKDIKGRLWLRLPHLK